jgi:hypothetical protein
MGNIFGSPEKFGRKSRLFEIGLQTLQGQGWTIERVPGMGKSSVRRIIKGGISKIVSIRTTQDTYIAFPRDKADKSWVTLGNVDAVVAVSVDDAKNPKYALVHMIDGDEMRDRFDRAYKARLKAGHSIPVGRGVWVPLYIQDTATSNVGGGAGLAHPAIARVPLNSEVLPSVIESPEVNEKDKEPLLTLQEAKRRLAITLGVDPSNIKIIIDA